ncbi:MAG: DNA translocase FtsK 4TM domain-containing protein [Patescibacteria group bacterium]
MARRKRPGRPKGTTKHRSRNEKNYDQKEYEPLLSAETKRGIAIIFLLALGAISLLGLFGLAGTAGIYIKIWVTHLFGWAIWLFPIILFLSAYFLIVASRYSTGFINYFGLLIFTLSFNGLLHLRIPLEEAGQAVTTGRGGGYLGLFLSYPLQKIMGFWATLVALVALLLIALLLTFNTSLSDIAEKSFIFNSVFKKIGGLFHRRAVTENNEEDEEYYGDEEDEEGSPTKTEEKTTEPERIETEAAKIFSAKKIIDKPQPILAKKFKKIDIPLDLLADRKEKPTSGDIRVNQERIKKTLENFGIQVEMGEVSVGPTVTQYTLKPSEGVKLSQITTLHNDLALALAAHPIRIEAPIPGKSLVGIEVPNQTIATVSLREILSSKEFALRKSNLTMALGKDVAGKSWVANLDAMPHLLIAGSTGSGKTVCVNSIIVSLLFQNSPNTLRLILVDPKRVELPTYNGIPHLLTPAITDVKKTINALKWTIGEMDRRFELLAKVGQRDIHSYNRTYGEKMPYLVMVIDELADLMTSAGSEIENYIIRLAQMARAVGIHLILATQRPSVDIITGLIKANITSRIAFAVASAVDSRTILDHSGAEKLLGRGDMLYVSANLSKPKRLQGTMVSDDEIRRIVEYIKSQNGEPEYNDNITERQSALVGGLNYSDEGGDELLEDAKDMIVKTGKASASYLQRRFKIGYARAARILDLLEEQGIIGPSDGAKPREILVTEIDEEDVPDDFIEDDGSEAEGGEVQESAVVEEKTEEIIETEKNEEEVEEESKEEVEEEVEPIKTKTQNKKAEDKVNKITEVNEDELI